MLQQKVEQMMLIVLNPGCLATHGIIHNNASVITKMNYHKGGIVRTSELPQVNSILRINVTGPDRELMENMKFTTVWMKLQEARNMASCFTFIAHENLLKHTRLQDLEKKIPVAILTTQAVDNQRLKL